MLPLGVGESGASDGEGPALQARSHDATTAFGPDAHEVEPDFRPEHDKYKVVIMR